MLRQPYTTSVHSRHELLKDQYTSLKACQSLRGIPVQNLVRNKFSIEGLGLRAYMDEGQHHVQ